MKTASSSTKLKATDSLDSRPAIYGRTVTSTFRKCFGMKHRPPGNLRTCWIPPVVFLTIFYNLPALLKLRRYLKKERSKRAPDDVRILFYSDNLDETNGIANNLRNVIPYMRAHGMKAFLAGSAFNTRPCGVIENSYCILLTANSPSRASARPCACSSATPLTSSNSRPRAPVHGLSASAHVSPASRFSATTAPTYRPTQRLS